MLIPSFNSGPLLARTMAAARAVWAPVWVVIDGSTDASPAEAAALAAQDPAFRVLTLLRNQGKGAALLHGLGAAAAHGFTHALAMDADGQHPADSIAAFMAASLAAPDALVMGVPVFGPDAPWARVNGRRLSNWLARLETGQDAGDVLFGFRVYPIGPMLEIMRASPGMRRYDFDPEAVVRLTWRGTPLIHLPAPVRYPGPAEDGVSHFRYGRDNLRFALMHCRLVAAAMRRAMSAHRSTSHAP